MLLSPAVSADQHTTPTTQPVCTPGPSKCTGTSPDTPTATGLPANRILDHADWTDLELMPPDCALTGGLCPCVRRPATNRTGPVCKRPGAAHGTKGRQGRFRCLKIQIQVLVTVFASLPVTDNYGNRWQLLTCQWTTISGLCWLRSARWVSAPACTPTAHIQRAMRN